jgi:hypothetical protein
MERIKGMPMKLVAVGAVIAVATGVFMGPHGPSGCTPSDVSTSGCVSGNNNGGGVTLKGHKKSPGSGGNSSGSNSSKSKKHKPCTGLPEACQKFIIIPPGAPGNPAVTITDIRNFPATPGTDHMEPNGWMIVGLPTNFYSVVGVEIKNGTLLGQPASVRFTPISWHWTYGDGKDATRGTKGATWAAQRIPEFDPTPTSHVYRKDGTYYIDLSITFRAEYKFSTGDWTPVIGTITLPANRLKASAGDAKTVLVNHDCSQNPSGPGC